jgi:hypothetical protein
MDYTYILRELQSASLFDLHRLRAAIDFELDRPERIEQVRRQLKIGQTIDYFDATSNGLIQATVVELNRTRLVIENHHDRKRWSIPFSAVNVNQVAVDIAPESAQQPLDRNRLSVGDMVGFRDRQNEEQYGRVLALNQKTASILTNQGQRWRVAYALLFKVMDTESGQSAAAKQSAPPAQPADMGEYKILELSFEDEDQHEVQSLQPATSPALPATPQSVTVTASAVMKPKVGANEPCPCGSGKKYKRCCRR